MQDFLIQAAERLENALVARLDNYVQSQAVFMVVYVYFETHFPTGFSLISYGIPTLLIIISGFTSFDTIGKAMFAQTYRNNIYDDPANAYLVKNTVTRDTNILSNQIASMCIVNPVLLSSLWVAIMCSYGHGRLQEVYVPTIVAQALCAASGALYGHIMSKTIQRER